jgi:hypothetical protein
MKLSSEGQTRVVALSGESIPTLEEAPAVGHFEAISTCCEADLRGHLYVPKDFGAERPARVAHALHMIPIRDAHLRAGRVGAMARKVQLGDPTFLASTRVPRMAYVVYKTLFGAVVLLSGTD